MSEEKQRAKRVIEGAEQLSLGISMIVAVLFGWGMGYLMKKYIGYDWLLWLGVAWGIAAAIVNVFKASQRQKQALVED